MNNQEILTKAIEKAVEGGWEDADTYPYCEPVHAGIGTAKNRLFFGDCAEVTMLLFQHEFAKALWGEGERPNCLCDYENWDCGEVQHNTNAWQYHLQRMVIAEDPIKYLGENLD